MDAAIPIPFSPSAPLQLGGLGGPSEAALWIQAHGTQLVYAAVAPPAPQLHWTGCSEPPQHALCDHGVWRSSAGWEGDEGFFSRGTQVCCKLAGFPVPRLTQGAAWGQAVGTHKCVALGSAHTCDGSTQQLENKERTEHAVLPFPMCPPASHCSQPSNPSVRSPQSFADLPLSLSRSDVG